MNKSKQVIVMRKEFIVDGKKVTPRKGKYIAQGAHASLAAILDQMDTYQSHTDGFVVSKLYMDKESALFDWVKGSFTKVCCSVDTEEELLDVYNKAKAKGLICSLITDKGLTEFNGVPTIICCAIGPAWSDELEEITGNLKLF